MRAHQRLRAPIGPLTRTAIPARHVVFDTEARLAEGDSVQVQTWAVGAAQLLDLTRRATGADRDVTIIHTPETLWQTIDGWCRPKSRVIAWAHNLAYDLRISRALEQLPALGWELDGIMLEEGTAWAAFSQDERSLLCCDLVAWLPASLERIARDLGASRGRFDYGRADGADLAMRCADDVRITTRAVLTLLDFIRREDLGAFKPTGAGQGFSAWRRRFLTHPVWVHNEPDVLDAERVAIWPGRCEAWRWGEIGPAAVHEYDLELAHAHIGLECSVPVEYHGAVRVRNYLDLERLLARFAILAQVKVRTRTPTVPAQGPDGVLWPVGEFTTTLWDPELRQAWQDGAHVEVLRAWAYRRAPALRAASDWIIRGVRGQLANVGPLERRLIKHWSRTLVGRFALRYRSWQEDGTHPILGLRAIQEYDADQDVHRELLHIGHKMFELSDLTEAAISCPAITGWVASECRRRLWSLCKAAGHPEVLYLDTDCLIVTGAGRRRLEALMGDGRAFSLRHKLSTRTGRILGPRQLELGDERRFAGIPLGARESGALTYAGEVWQSMRDSARAGRLTSVTVQPRTFRLRATDRRREHLPGGDTSPITLQPEDQ